MMRLEHEGKQYGWYYDSLYGVGRFIRKSDNAVTFMDTGSDCQDTRRSFNRLSQKTASPRYPKAAPSFVDVFDSIASEYTYHGE